MKIKKLLSIGALALVLACSTSVSASAINSTGLPIDKKIEIAGKVLQNYQNGRSPINNVDFKVLQAEDYQKIHTILQDFHRLDNDTTTQNTADKAEITTLIKEELGNSVEVKFGKNAFGQTTISVEKGDQIIVEINTNGDDADILQQYLFIN